MEEELDTLCCQRGGSKKVDDSHYIHGTDPDEQRRLTRLNDLLNRRSLTELRARPGQRVLDVGSGLGQLSRAIARAVQPGGLVVAVERDPEQLAEAERQARADTSGVFVDFRQGDAVDLPLSHEEWGTFDLVHTRFVLEHVSDPEAVVRAMFEAARPGGRVVMEDDDHDLLRLWPEVDEVSRLWEAYIHVYEALGNDPFVGRRLIELLNGAGATDMRNEMLHFGSCSGDPNFTYFVANFVGIFRGAADAIVEGGELTASEVEDGVRALESWGQRGDVAIWYATCWASGRKPGEAEATSSSGLWEHETDTGKEAEEETVSLAAFLAESARDLNSSLRLDQVFKKIADRVHRLLDYHLFCVMLWNEEAQLLQHSYSLRFGEHVEQEGGFALGQGLSGSAAQLRSAIRVDDVAEDPRYVRFRHAEVDVRSELAVPLVVKDRLVGVVDLESTEYAAFDAEHEQVLSALASHIAIALENARLYEELRMREGRMQDDLETARIVQRGLLPQHEITLAGIEVAGAFESAVELSGDFYDVVPYRDGRVALAVADVAGKGAGAAMYGALAVGALRGRALRHAADPTAMLDYLDEQLIGLEISRRFLAIVLAVWDPRERALTIANAGLPLPLHLHEGQLRELDLSGLPVGQMRGGKHPVKSFPGATGDVFAFFSDGVVDCRNRAGEVFGADRIGALLTDAHDQTAGEIAERILKGSQGFSGGDAEEDDRTVLVVRITPED